MIQRPMHRFLHLLPWLVLTGLVLALTAKKIDLATADLGRHIANGRWIWQDPSVLYRNFYSYTYPDADFINHHWLSGVLFYGVEKLAGFTGLSVLYLALTGATFLVMARLAWRSAGPGPALAFGLLVVPLVSYRTEIRPEAFSAFLAAVYYALLRAHADRRMARDWVWVLPILTIVWINLHIYFVFGLGIIGAFWLEALLGSKLRATEAERSAAQQAARQLFAVGIACVATSFINPFGWRLVIYPLHIFDNYGYMIFENQSVPFFLNRNMQFPVFIPLYVALALLWGGSALRLLASRRDLPLASILLALVFSAMALNAIRNISLFGFFVLPTLALLWHAIPQMPRRRTKPLLLTLSVACSTYGFAKDAWEPTLGTMGIGVREGVGDAAAFFQREHLHGPLFNNYDIGGYLIYYLFPDTPVFVDNRPEAYPASFMTDVYVPMQEQATKWQEQDDKFHFNTIFFYWHDYTPAGQDFLMARINDPQWAPVFVDSYALIFLRRTAENAGVIARYEIPRDRFSVRRQP